MSTKTIFFSYSRENSEFVLKLAKELRKAGANIWLDQLDIKPGVLWDQSIEKALESSKTFLVILSKPAVASKNVMDEVSFALEEGKNIIPVLLEDCDIPFRLRRFQFADFTQDPKKGFDTLIEALQIKENSDNIDIKGVENEISKSKKTALDKLEKSVSSPSDESTKSSISKGNSTIVKPKISKNKIYISILIVIIILGGIWAFTRPNADESDWQKINKNSNLEAFDSHLKKFTDCVHKEAAITKIVKLKYDKKDSESWIKINTNLTLENLNKHIEDFPSCPHTALIKIKLDSLADINKDNNEWKIAMEAFSPDALNKYKVAFPNGIHINEADSIINKFKTRNSVDADKTDYEKIKNTNDVAKLEMHYKLYTNCIHKSAINRRIKEINKDALHWKSVEIRPSARGYYDYIVENKNGAHLKKAKTNLYEILKNNPSGYVYMGKSNNAKTAMYSSRNFDVFLRDANAIPKTGDLIKAKHGINIRKMPVNTSAVLGNISSGKPLMVLEVIIQAQTSYWLKVAKIK